MSEKIPHILEERLRVLPRLPGVYLMKNDANEVLYVGKAKNLRARVRSYFNFTDSRLMVRFLIDNVHAVETIVTVDEREALVLENDLIKQHHPRYNARLKDDRAHLIVRIGDDHPYPRLELVRRREDDGARYIGPFAFTHEVRTLLDIINRTVPLRTCTDKVMANRVRPCLEYQIGRCSGPCCLPVDKTEYRHWLDQAVEILDGRSADVVLQLEAEMERASEALRYEDAAEYRDRLAVLKQSRKEPTAHHYGSNTKDIFGLYRQESNAELVVLTVRKGRLAGGRTFGVSNVELGENELIPSLVSQYYEQGVEFPDEILLPVPIEDRTSRESLYTELAGHSVKIHVPKRGVKHVLVRLAEENARENFRARFGGAKRGDTALVSLQEVLQLSQLPRIIECIDVSHFQGGETVASVVVFRDGQPDRERYRMFNLTQEGKPDDFASMREVVFRHLSRAAEENTLPDLIVIDGGPAQLNQALLKRRELGLNDPPMIGLAKRRTVRTPYRMQLSSVRHKPERIYRENESAPLILNPTSEALQLLERVRDEAHRFAISFHRRRRQRKLYTSELARIPGIGERRRKRLLREFGSVQAIRESSPEEVTRRCNFPPALAERVVQLLNLRKSEES